MTTSERARVSGETRACFSSTLPGAITRETASLAEKLRTAPAGAPTASPPEVEPAEQPIVSPQRGIRGFLARHKTLFWWLHSFYALGLGVMVILFAQKGFAHARVLAATLGAALLVMLIVFRVFGHGAHQREAIDRSRGSKVRFLLITYLLKNLYQPMLFFVLPFYWKASTIDSTNGWLVFLLGLLAFLSTMDLIFDHVLVRYRAFAATYYGITLFACVNLVIPALFPNVPTIVSLIGSAVLSVAGFWLLHFSPASLKRGRSWVILAFVAAGFAALVYTGRHALPPVPLYIQHGAVGTLLLDDRRLGLEVTRLHTTQLGDLWAVTDVALPGGEGDTFHHTWRHRDGTVYLALPTEKVPGETAGAVRLVSAFPRASLPARAVGRWQVDVMTADDQLVGRVRFEVIE